MVNNYSVLSGNATVNGDLTNSGTLASGTYVINGNYTATASSVHQFKVGGTTTGSYDRLTATGNVNLAGTLTVTLKIGYTPTTDQDLPILTGTINGTFSTVNLPPNYSLVYNPDNVTLRRRTDVDSDGVWDSQDNCTTVANADQKDTDGDGQGDACDTDDDGDGITDSLDKCPLIASTINTDNDGDGLGDVCDPDDDNDGWDDVVDNCPKAPNPNQEDFDADGIGDWCDFDRDGDGLDNSFDNCPQIPNIDQLDTDGDWDGDVCDWDDDDDLIADGKDNCPTTANADQRDSDGDGLGDACDGDDDGDGTPDIQDCAPLNAAVHPGAADICNGIDDDCDGLVDEDCATVLPAISIADAVVYEAAGSVTLTVSLSKAPSQNVKVVFTTVNGTAVASGKGRNAQGDYTATKGTLTFRAGSLTGTITIPIANDGAAEGDEQFSVQLSAPTNATIQDGAATVTIKDGVAPGLTQARADKAGQPELLMGRLTVQATPNPSQHRFALVTRSGSSQPLDIKVLDMLGRVVEQRSGVAANGTYYLGDRYRPGVYQVRVVQGGQIQTLKLVKQP